MTQIGIKEMVQSQKKEISDRDVRHFIYANFAQTSRPSSTLETAAHFKISIAAFVVPAAHFWENIGYT